MRRNFHENFITPVGRHARRRVHLHRPGTCMAAGTRR